MENRFAGLNAPETPEFRQKFKVVFSVVLIVFTLLLMRLCYLQVIKATELRERSENNTVRFRKIPPMRGIIMDRNGVVLADNLPSFDIVYMPGTTEDNEQLISRLQ
ncbi:MAG TPA: penicillin-binding protein 2, partial [Deltaproteobacteria bacterium]|nr:penicillin-binding protein 2 [Deltaproteobacteria bacterium]